MADIVLVAGGFHGGWYFDPIVTRLEAAGHRVSAPTLPGLDPRAPVDALVNLDSHIDAVREVIVQQEMENVVLVGHSYGGTVITGAAALAPESIAQLIHLDTVFPRSGQSVLELVSAEIQSSIFGACDDGFMVLPDPGLLAMDPRVVAHPIATFLQRLHYDEQSLTMPKSYASAEQGPYTNVYRSVLGAPGWDCASLPYGHDLVREAPEVVADFILERVPVRT
jgi:pimeloyl-ACP methyl ester carboxylesterase